MSLHKINKHYRYIAIPSDSKDLPWWQLLQQLKSFTASVPRCIQVAYNYVRWGQWHYYFSYYSTSDVQRDVFCEPHRRRIFSRSRFIVSRNCSSPSQWYEVMRLLDHKLRLYGPGSSTTAVCRSQAPLKIFFLINIIMPRVVHTYMCVPIPTCVYPYLHVCTILTCM